MSDIRNHIRDHLWFHPQFSWEGPYYSSDFARKFMIYLRYVYLSIMVSNTTSISDDVHVI